MCFSLLSLKENAYMCYLIKVFDTKNNDNRNMVNMESESQDENTT